MPIERIRDIEKYFYRASCGVAGYTRHALWIIPSPITTKEESSAVIWAKGSLHLIVSTSSTGYTRFQLDPPAPFAGEATALVLCYVGEWEAIYESWNHSQRKGGPWPVALEALFRNMSATGRIGARAMLWDESGFESGQLFKRRSRVVLPSCF